MTRHEGSEKVTPFRGRASPAKVRGTLALAALRRIGQREQPVNLVPLPYGAGVITFLGGFTMVKATMMPSNASPPVT